MRLYFLRHGIAEDGGPGLPDMERRLTEEGIEELRHIARALARLEVRLDLILTSPARRARETAQLVAEGLADGVPVRQAASLSPGCRLGGLQSALSDHPGARRVMVVGHEPDFSTLVGMLTGGSVEMKKAGLARVELSRPEPGGGYLEWLVPPKVLAGLGR